jgi:hypothetical protein
VVVVAAAVAEAAVVAATAATGAAAETAAIPKAAAGVSETSLSRGPLAPGFEPTKSGKIRGRRY